MAKEVVQTVIAEQDYFRVIDYLASHWGDKVLYRFIARFDQIVTILENDPGRFPFVEESKNIQKCILTPHNMLYFINKANVVEIITIFDTRQDPEKLFRLI